MNPRGVSQYSQWVRVGVGSYRVFRFWYWYWVFFYAQWFVFSYSSASYREASRGGRAGRSAANWVTLEKVPLFESLRRRGPRSGESSDIRMGWCAPVVTVWSMLAGWTCWEGGNLRKTHLNTGRCGHGIQLRHETKYTKRIPDT